METSNTENKIIGIRQGFTAEKRLLQKERDSKIISLVSSYQTVTCELVTALLGMERTPSNVNLVERRLRLLAGQKFFRQVRQDNVTYTVGLAIKLRADGERAQLVHRTMQSRFWGTLLNAVDVIDRKTDREFRADGGIANGRIVPDGYFTLKGRNYFVECETGFASFDHALKKSEEYRRQLDYLRMFHAGSIQVLWVNRLASRTADMLRRFGGGMHLVTNESSFSPFDPQTILQGWRSPKDDQPHSLVKD